jgi:hypothetical protein
MNPAHTLLLASCLVLACGGGCFECEQPPAPVVEVQTPDVLEAKSRAVDANGEPVVVELDAAEAVKK